MDQIKSYSDEIRDMVGDLNIEFLGLIKEKDILLSYMSHAALLVYPSHIEAMSMMLLESITVDCPVICSDIVQNKDILDDDEALFFKSQDADDLAEKIKWALVNDGEMKSRAQKAKGKFLKEFNWGFIAAQYKEIYLKFLK